jgi:hypothetical protein
MLGKSWGKVFGNKLGRCCGQLFGNKLGTLCWNAFWEPNWPTLVQRRSTFWETDCAAVVQASWNTFWEPNWPTVVQTSCNTFWETDCAAVVQASWNTFWEPNWPTVVQTHCNTFWETDCAAVVQASSGSQIGQQLCKQAAAHFGRHIVQQLEPNWPTIVQTMCSTFWETDCAAVVQASSGSQIGQQLCKQAATHFGRHIVQQMCKQAGTHSGSQIGQQLCKQHFGTQIMQQVCKQAETSFGRQILATQNANHRGSIGQEAVRFRKAIAINLGACMLKALLASLVARR